MKARQSQTLPVRIRPRALTLAPLLLCLFVGQARAEDDPEPPRPKGELVELFAKLQDKDYNVVNKAKAELWQRVKPKDVPLLAWMARRGQPEERKCAFSLMSKFLPKDLPKDDVERRIVPAILDGMGSRNVVMRRCAVITAGWYSTHSKALVDRLIELLDDREEAYKVPTCEAALLSLTYASRTDERVVPLMYQHAMKGHMRLAALDFMGRMGRIDGRAVSKVLPVLATVLKNRKEDVAVRQAAARGLYFLGNRGEPVYPILVEVFRDPGVKDAKDAAAIKSATLEVISSACSGTTGSNAEKGKPELFKALVPDMVKIVEGEWGEIKDEFYRRELLGAALSILRSMGPLAKAAVPALEKLLPKTEGSQRFHVTKTLEAIKEK